MVKIQTPLKNGTVAVDPTLFSPDIIVLGDVRGFLSLTFDILRKLVEILGCFCLDFHYSNKKCFLNNEPALIDSTLLQQKNAFWKRFLKKKRISKDDEVIRVETLDQPCHLHCDKTNERNAPLIIVCNTLCQKRHE